MSRIEETFARLKTKNKKAFISFIMSGDPNFQTSLDIVSKLPKVGVDIIELGIPFTDPMADGPAIQRAGQRALNSGMTLQKVLDMVAEFRKNDSATPIILMGYFNPILAFGINNFIDKCKSVGVDGLIVVDLPPEEDSELCIPAMKNGLDFITAISGAATSISNVGPGLGPIIGPNGDFSSLPDLSKWILTVGMILGRLELFAILVLFLPSFWKN